MIEKISRTEEIHARLEAEGKTQQLDFPKDLENMLHMNEMMQQVHDEHTRMQIESEQSAAE